MYYEIKSITELKINFDMYCNTISNMCNIIESFKSYKLLQYETRRDVIIETVMLGQLFQQKPRDNF